MTDLLELAARCEAATGPDAKLNEAIEKSLPCSRRFAEDNPHAPPTQWNERAARFHGSRIGDLDSCDEYVSPRYTASLDAAMTLVPEGLHVVHAGEGRFMTRSPGFIATVEEWETEIAEDGGEIATRPMYRHGVASTLPLALTAAALRAIAHQMRIKGND